MATVPGLMVFVARQLLDGACKAVGVTESGKTVVGFLSRHLTDHSQRLTRALQEATDRAWKALEVALAGDSLLDRMASAQDRQLRQQLRTFLDTSMNRGSQADVATRQRALHDLRAARKAGRTRTLVPVRDRNSCRAAADAGVRSMDDVPPQDREPGLRSNIGDRQCSEQATGTGAGFERFLELHRASEQVTAASGRSVRHPPGGVSHLAFGEDGVLLDTAWRELLWLPSG